MDLITSAKSYATLHHVIRKGQLYGVLPYTHHLAAVEGVLREFGEEDETLLVAAWLHDIVEDTDTKARDVEENFGDEIARLVSAVTSEKGENRKVRNALTYPKIRKAGHKAIRLKLADRIANVRTAGGNLEKYKEEYPEFRHGLFVRNVTVDEMTIDVIRNDRMWMCLDSLMGHPVDPSLIPERK